MVMFEDIGPKPEQWMAFSKEPFYGQEVFVRTFKFLGQEP